MKVLRIVVLLFAFTAFGSWAPKVSADDPCTPLTDAPLLYQINRTPTQATLFFTPIKTDQTQSYSIVYGLNAEDERYSLSVNQGPSSGAISYAVGDLTPGVQYFYKVQGNTSCTSSPWSAWEGDKPVTEGMSTTTPGIPVTGPEATVIFSTIAGLLILFGFGLFTYSRRRS